MSTWTSRATTTGPRRPRLRLPRRACADLRGGSGPLAAKLAGPGRGRLHLQSGKDPALYDELLAKVAEGAEAAGRDPAAIRRMIEVKVSYDRDRQRALDNCRWWAALALTPEQKEGVQDPLEIERLADETPTEPPLAHRLGRPRGDRKDPPLHRARVRRADPARAGRGPGGLPRPVRPDVLPLLQLRHASGSSDLHVGRQPRIGLAIAVRAARDGVKVAPMRRPLSLIPKLPGTIYTAAEEIEAAGGEALPIVGDIRDDEAVEAAVAQTVERFGGSTSSSTTPAPSTWPRCATSRSSASTPCSRSTRAARSWSRGPASAPARVGPRARAHSLPPLSPTRAGSRTTAPTRSPRWA